MKYFKHFDLFGNNVSLLYQGNKNIRTSLGGFFFLVIALLLVLLILGFGQDFFNRTNPSVIREAKIPNEYPVYSVTNKNFSIAVRLEDDEANLIKDFTSVYLEALLIQYKKVNGVWEAVFYGELDLHQCTEEMFFSKQIYKENYLQDFLCPIFNNTLLGGSWSSDYVGFLYFNIWYCEEGNVNNKGEKCATKEVTDEIIDGGRAWYSNFIQSAIVTPSNYTDGLAYTTNNEFFLISNKMRKVMYYYFSMTTMNTDYGWILQTEEISSYIGFNKKML